MADAATPTYKSPSRFQFNLIFEVLIRPRRAFEQINESGAPTWLTPMLVLTLTGLFYVAVRGWLQSRAAMMGEIPLPQDWQWWTPDMQNQYMQAQSATQGPVFMYVFPAVSMLIGLWLGWVVVGGLLHLALTMLGGRGSTGSIMNMVAWAWLPFAVRDLLRVAFMLVTRSAIQSPGLSGFAPLGDGGGSLFLAALLGIVDLFLMWHIALLMVGAQAGETISTRQAVLGVLIVMLVVLAAQAGLNALTGSLGELMITRPFF